MICSGHMIQLTEQLQGQNVRVGDSKFLMPYWSACSSCFSLEQCYYFSHRCTEGGCHRRYRWYSTHESDPGSERSSPYSGWERSQRYRFSCLSATDYRSARPRTNVVIGWWTPFTDGGHEFTREGTFISSSTGLFKCPSPIQWSRQWISTMFLSDVEFSG